MKVFDGKHHAEILDNYIKAVLSKREVTKKLLIVLVGDNPASLKYVGVKTRLCENLGIPYKLLKLDALLSDEEIFKQTLDAFADPRVGGGLVQLPLPRQSLNKILDMLPGEKDVDLISSTCVDQFYHSDFHRLPPVVRAFVYYLSIALQNGAPLIQVNDAVPFVTANSSRLEATIIGNGFLVGKPIRYFLAACNVSCDKSEKHYDGDKIYSNLLILGAGHPNLVNPQDISPGCNVIDFGTTVVDGKLIGDLNKNEDASHLGVVSFSPGGIGPVVVRFLLLNFLDLL